MKRGDAGQPSDITIIEDSQQSYMQQPHYAASGARGSSSSDQGQRRGPGGYAPQGYGQQPPQQAGQNHQMPPQPLRKGQKAPRPGNFNFLKTKRTIKTLNIFRIPPHAPPV